MEILTEVIVIYLRILRTQHLHEHTVLISALKGLARFSILVNLELLNEILSELKNVLKDALDSQRPATALLTLYCAFRLMLSPGGRVLSVDLNWLSKGFIDTLPLVLLYNDFDDQEVDSKGNITKMTFSIEDEEESERKRRAGNGNFGQNEDDNFENSNSSRDLLRKCLLLSQQCPQAFSHKQSLATLALLVEQLFNTITCTGSFTGTSSEENGSKNGAHQNHHNNRKKFGASNFGRHQQSHQNAEGEAAGSNNGPNLLVDADKLFFQKHYRLATMLQEEGGLFGVGGVVERPLSVFWNLLCLAKSYDGNAREYGKLQLNSEENGGSSSSSGNRSQTMDVIQMKKGKSVSEGNGKVSIEKIKEQSKEILLHNNDPVIKNLMMTPGKNPHQTPIRALNTVDKEESNERAVNFVQGRIFDRNCMLKKASCKFPAMGKIRQRIQPVTSVDDLEGLLKTHGGEKGGC
jgi:hypothetical protein